MKLQKQLKLGLMSGLGFIFTDLGMNWEGNHYTGTFFVVLGIISICAFFMGMHQYNQEETEK